jgi:DNA replication initiation complex subunit (GINS family)
MDTDDDFVDRSLDVSQEISDEEADDQAENENESQNEGLDETSPAYDADHQQVDVISVGSDEEGDEKENEPVSEDDGREMLVAEVPPSTPASPSRAVSTTHLPVQSIYLSSLA